MFFTAYAFKGQVHEFAGQVKTVSHSSCRTGAILKYFCSLLYFKLSEGLQGLATIYKQQENMAEAKKLMTRALELAVDVVGQRHHFCAAIFTKVCTSRVKSGKFRQQVNSDTHLQTVEIQMRRLLMSRLIRIFIVC